MGFEEITTEQALKEYEGKLDAMGLNQSQKSLFTELMRAELEEWDKSFQELQGLISELPTTATGEYLNRSHMGHEWRGPAGSETTAPADDTEPPQNHVRDAVRANQ